MSSLITVVLACHLLVTFALIARVRALQALVVARRDPDLPDAGAPVGAFTTVTTTGRALTDVELRGASPTLVGFFTPHCDACEHEKASLLARPPAMPFVAFVDGAPDDPDAASLAQSLGAVARTVYTHDGDAAMAAFGSPRGFPTLLRIERGAIVAAGHRVREVMP